jgi:TetR/AcrR family transcriptional regulator, transcriptional repressor for nem operon
MARASRAQAETNRQAITHVSARLMRERGIKGVSVSDLMSAAGLTHGGFYGHFESKEALVAEACTYAFKQSVERWNKRVAGEVSKADALQALVDGYLSTRTRDNPGTSCPTAALVADVAREPEGSASRSAYLSGVNELLGILESVQVGGTARTDRRRAMAQFSTMVGALLLARATAGDAISDDFLTTAREMLAPASRLRS